MGCVLGKDDLASRPPSGDVVVVEKRDKGEERDFSGRREELVVGCSVSKSEEEVAAAAGGGQVESGSDQNEKRKEENVKVPKGERRRSRPNPRLSNPSKNIHGEQVAAGWPFWLSRVAGEAINGWIPRRADSFEKIDKIGQGTYSIVYKARDTITGKIVALKKVRFNMYESESVEFMAREILILRRLDHPNVMKLQGLATSRMPCSLYLVFNYMVHDLAGLASTPGIKFTEPQVKCYMHQLFSGLEHCHDRNVMHRDIKGSNLLIDDEGVLKIADFGLALTFDPNNQHPMTSHVVTLWYRPPELLLGATYYGVGVDLWSAGCILAELFAGKPIMTGQTEVDQLFRIFKLCGYPSEEYLTISKFPHATMFKPLPSYKRCIKETFKDFPQSSLPLIDTLLAIDPSQRHTATEALKSEFFTTNPYACDPSSLPKYPPSKEIDAKRREQARRFLKIISCLHIDKRRLINHGNAKSKSEKFPPPHQDGGLGYPIGSSHHIDPTLDPPDVPFSSMNFRYPKDPMQTWSGPLVEPGGIGAQRRKSKPSNKGHRKDTDSSWNKEKDDI